MEVLSPGGAIAVEAVTPTNGRRCTPRAWGRAEETTLLDMVGTQSIPTVARCLRRTPKAVRSKLQRMGAPLEDLAGFKGKDLINLLNVTPKQVRRWREKGYLKSVAGRITEESLEAFCRDHPEKIPYHELSEHVQLWLRDLGYPAVEGISPRELAGKLCVSRRRVTYWLRRAWLREIDGKIPTDSLCRFCRAHSDQIPYGKLDEESREWLRSMGCLWLAEQDRPTMGRVAEILKSLPGHFQLVLGEKSAPWRLEDQSLNGQIKAPTLPKGGETV